jgi:hypothetical protein
MLVSGNVESCDVLIDSHGLQPRNRFARRWQMVMLTLALLLPTARVMGQTTAFTYQGKLTDSGNATNGQYDFQFKLYDTATVGTGTQQGNPVSVSNVTVTGGIFTAQLDFGACSSCFDGAPRFLEIAVKPTSGSTFTTVSPRQPITSEPYAIRSRNAATADGLSVACVGCVTSGQIQSVQGSQITGSISGGQITGTLPVASLPAGSGNYIQNTPPSPQSASFSISGNGTALGNLNGNVLNATTQFNLDGNRILSAPGSQNLFSGFSAAASYSSGTGNTFVGAGADFNLPSATGNGDTALGNLAAVQVNRTNATAIGSRAFAAGDNVIVLGSINGQNGATASTRVAIGMTSALYHLDVLDPSFLGLRVQSNLGGGTVASFGANGDFAIDSAGVAGGRVVVKENGRVGIGAPNPMRTGLQLGSDANALFTISPSDGTPNAGYLRFGDTTGWKLHIARSRESSGGALNTGVVGALVTIQDNGRVGIGTFVPRDLLEVEGEIRAACLKNFSGTTIAGTCASDARLKRDVRPFPRLLNTVARLQPVYFHWQKEQYPDRGFGEEESFGLVAQDVEEVMPELVAADKDGYKMVHYEKLPFLMLEAIKELKEENDSYRQRIQEQEAAAQQEQRMIDALTKLVCQDHPSAVLCKSHEHPKRTHSEPMRSPSVSSRSRIGSHTG